MASIHAVMVNFEKQVRDLCAERVESGKYRGYSLADRIVDLWATNWGRKEPKTVQELFDISTRLLTDFYPAHKQTVHDINGDPVEEARQQGRLEGVDLATSIMALVSDDANRLKAQELIDAYLEPQGSPTDA